MENNENGLEGISLQRVEYSPKGLQSRPELIFPIKEGQDLGRIKSAIAKDFTKYLHNQGRNYILEENDIGKVLLELVPEELRGEHPVRRSIGAHYVVSDLNNQVRIREERKERRTQGMLEGYLLNLRNGR